MAKKANKKKVKKQFSIEEKTKILNEILNPMFFKVEETWAGPGPNKVFMGWNIFRIHTGMFAKVKEFFDFGLIGTIHDESLNLVTLFEKIDAATVRFLAKTVKSKFGVEMHVYGGRNRIF